MLAQHTEISLFCPSNAYCTLKCLTIIPPAPGQAGRAKLWQGHNLAGTKHTTLPRQSHAWSTCYVITTDPNLAACPVTKDCPLILCVSEAAHIPPASTMVSSTSTGKPALPLFATTSYSCDSTSCLGRYVTHPFPSLPMLPSCIWQQSAERDGG